MAAIANIIINNGATTPVAQTYTPTELKDGVAMYENRVGGIAIGFPSITTSLRRPTKASPNYRGVLKMKLPVLEQTAPSTATGFQPAPTVAYYLSSETTFIIPQRSTNTDRVDFLALTRNMIANAVMQQMVVQLESQL